MKRRVITFSLALLACALTGPAAMAQTPKPKPKPKPVTVIVTPAPDAPDAPDTPPPAQEPRAPRPGQTPRAPVPAQPPKVKGPKTPKPGQAPLPPPAWGDEEDEVQSGARISAMPNVVVRITLTSGDISVQGWDKKEVAAEAISTGRVVLERSEEADEETPARQVTVHLRHKHEVELAHGATVCADDCDDEDCEEDSAEKVTLNVPQGATVYVKTANGDLRVMDVAEADAQTSNGDLKLERISRSVRGVTPNGDIKLAQATGRIELKALNGDVSVYDVQPGATGDYLRVSSASGSVDLSKVSHSNVEATSVSDEILFQGTLARGGNYNFRTTSGDITVIIPASSSFRLNARVSYGDINTDFNCRPEGDATSNDPKKGRLTGLCGKGEANLTLATFNGTITLQKQ